RHLADRGRHRKPVPARWRSRISFYLRKHPVLCAGLLESLAVPSVCCEFLPSVSLSRQHWNVTHSHFRHDDWRRRQSTDGVVGGRDVRADCDVLSTGTATRYTSWL